MKVLVQWATATPTAWTEFQSSDWSSLPKKGIPSLSPIDEAPGWINALALQGVTFDGWDHYHLRNLAGGGLRVTVWNDDPLDFPAGKKHAAAWIFRPLAPDANFGGAYNTRQNSIIYRDTDLITGESGKTQVERPWSEFVPPAESGTRHGIWLSNDLFEEHTAIQTRHGWREWTEGLPAEEIENGRLRPQRPLGRFTPSKGTRTYYQRDTDETTSLWAATNESDFLLSAGSGEQESSNALAYGTDELSHSWIAPEGEPDDTTWPTGDYRIQFDVNTADDALRYGLLTVGGSTGYFARITAAKGALVASRAQDDGYLSGTGLQSATYSGSWAGITATDRFAALCAVYNSAAHGGSKTFTLDYTSDAWADGPWPAAALPAEPVIPPRTVTPAPEPEVVVPPRFGVPRFYTAPPPSAPPVIRPLVVRPGPEPEPVVPSRFTRTSPFPFPASAVVPPVVVGPVVPPVVVPPPRFGVPTWYSAPPPTVSPVIRPLVVRPEGEPEIVVPGKFLASSPFPWPASPVIPFRRAPLVVPEEIVVQAIPWPVIREIVVPGAVSPVVPFLTVRTEPEPAPEPRAGFWKVLSFAIRPVVRFLTGRTWPPEEVEVRPGFWPVAPPPAAAPASPVVEFRALRTWEPETFEPLAKFWEVVRNDVAPAAASPVIGFKAVRVWEPPSFEPLAKFRPVVGPRTPTPPEPAAPVIEFRIARPTILEDSDVLVIPPRFVQLVHLPGTPPGPASPVLRPAFTWAAIHRQDVDPTLGSGFFPVVPYVLTWGQYQVDIYIDPDQFDPAATWFLEAWLKSSDGQPVRARLMEVSTDHLMASVETTSTSTTRLRSDAFTIENAGDYRVEVGKQASGGVTAARVDLIYRQ